MSPMALLSHSDAVVCSIPLQQSVHSPLPLIKLTYRRIRVAVEEVADGERGVGTQVLGVHGYSTGDIFRQSLERGLLSFVARANSIPCKSTVQAS